MHGHSYRLEITLEGEVRNGVVADFHALKALVESTILSKLDHTCLNDVIAYPSAENIAVWIWDILVMKRPPEIRLDNVRVWETETSMVEYDGS
jgi:6-pyruvoyltetrahydropterin/6-carboxytetrahydropterin synthase